jgi:hypothetical protein
VVIIVIVFRHKNMLLRGHCSLSEAYDCNQRKQYQEKRNWLEHLTEARSDTIMPNVSRWFQKVKNIRRYIRINHQYKCGKSHVFYTCLITKVTLLIHRSIIDSKYLRLLVRIFHSFCKSLFSSSINVVKKSILSFKLAHQKYNFVNALVLNLGTKLRWGVSFKLQQLCLQKVHPVWLVGRSGQEIFLLPLISHCFGRPSSSLLTLPIALSRLTRSLDVCKWPMNASSCFIVRVLFITTTSLCVRPLHRMCRHEEWSKTKKG